MGSLISRIESLDIDTDQLVCFAIVKTLLGTRVEIVYKNGARLSGFVNPILVETIYLALPGKNVNESN